MTNINPSTLSIADFISNLSLSKDGMSAIKSTFSGADTYTDYDIDSIKFIPNEQWMTRNSTIEAISKRSGESNELSSFISTDGVVE